MTVIPEEKSKRYLAHLAKVCRTLAGSNIVKSKANGVFIGAGNLLEELRAVSPKRKSFSLQIDPNWKVRISNDNICGVAGETELYFGGVIEFEERCLKQQALTVVVLFRSKEGRQAKYGVPCLVKNENHVVRRFHFDFDGSPVNPHTPLAHLQVGGKLSEEYLVPSGIGECRYELFDELDLPRLPWMMVDLALVLDTFLRQFPSDLEEFIISPGWQKQVKISEELWLKGFFNKAAQLLNGDFKSRQSLYDFCCTPSQFDAS